MRSALRGLMGASPLLRWTPLMLGVLALACAPNPAAMAAEDLRAAEPPYIAPPPGHPFGLVEPGMSTSEVRVALGKPTSLRRFPTPWAFVPFYLGSDERRTEWKYVGEGRILFMTDGETGELKVLRVEYDPRELGV